MIKISGVYAITPTLDDDALLAATNAAIVGGIQLLQYRQPSATRASKIRQARRLAALCRQHQVRLIINNAPDIAQSVGADGVHLGQDDTSIIAARQQLGQSAIIGVTCHNNIMLALAAKAAGADYVACGSVFPSPTKPTACHCPLSVIADIRRQTALPTIAIGGITVDNAPSVIRAGADGIALISGLFATDDITATARQLVSLYQ